MPPLNVRLEIYMNKINTQNLFKLQISLFFSKPLSMIIKLQTKIQIIQQHNKSKLKNTYRIKEIIVKGKI